MLKTIKPLYLHIAGFYIGIRFTPMEQPYLVRKDIRAFYKRRFWGYVIYPPDKVDYWIEFVQQTSFEVIVKDDRSNYFVNFYKIAPKKVQTFYHISFQQFQIILRNILQNLLVKNQGLFFHASASLVNNQAYLFLGKSGAGKSTTTQRIEKKFPILTDDNVIIKKDKNDFVFYQPPLLEKNLSILRYGKKYHLGKFFFLKKSQNFSITKITKKESITEKLVQQFLTDKESLDLQMPQLLQFVAHYDDFYALELSLNHEAELIQYILHHDQKK